MFLKDYQAIYGLANVTENNKQCRAWPMSLKEYETI
jgi:hypothetical protein